MTAQLRIVREHLKRLYTVQDIISLASWDQQVNMPERGASGRAEQLALLAEMHHNLSIDGAFVEALRSLGDRRDLSAEDAAIVRETWRESERALKLPASLVREVARAESETQATWVLARDKSSFAVVRDVFSRLLKLKIEVAKILGEGDPYDTMLDLFEPGMSRAIIDPLFSDIGENVSRMVERLRPYLAATPIKGNFPVAAQRELFGKVVSTIGFDLSRGRIDPTVHPFCSDMGPDDIRLTTRYRESDFTYGLFSLIHEAGHGLYEQGYLSQYHYTPLAKGCSLAVHESQSLLWEKQVGLSLSFWRYLFPKVREQFPDWGANYDAESFWKVVNQVRPGPVRLRSDEMTYALHIIIRYDVEKLLVGGDITLDDLPDVWKAHYKRYLNVEPANELEGVLQDTHWYIGAIGYFPTYLLGSMCAAQLFSAYRRAHPEVITEIKSGIFAPLLSWLRGTIHRHGKLYPAQELIKRASGEEPTSKYLLEYFRIKYSEMYGVAL